MNGLELAAELNDRVCPYGFAFYGPLHFITESETWLNPCQSSGQLRHWLEPGRQSMLPHVRHVLSRVSDRKRFYLLDERA